MEILSLDYGDRRIGYATASDALDMAFAKGYVLNDKNIKSSINGIISENNPKKIVIGLPLRKDMTFTPATDKALAFGKMLFGFVEQELFMVDERFTTAFSQVHLRESGRTVKNSKKIIDAESAKAIAETFLKRPSWIFEFDDENLSSEKISDYIKGSGKVLYFFGAFDIFSHIKNFNGEYSIFELNPYCYSMNRSKECPSNVREYTFKFSVEDEVELCS
jgi:putative Holliday junction resolvase